MKLTKLAAIVALSTALALLIVGVVSAAPARSNQAAALNAPASAAVLATADISGTHSMTNPVAVMLSAFFHGSYGDVIDLRDAGFGFGEIARAYFIAKVSKDGVTPQQVLQQFKSGTGWGAIMKEYAFKSGHGNNLGAIMRGGHGAAAPAHSNLAGSGKPNCPGNSCQAPGQNKNSP